MRHYTFLICLVQIPYQDVHFNKDLVRKSLLPAPVFEPLIKAAKKPSRLLFYLIWSLGNHPSEVRVTLWFGGSDVY